MQETQEMSFMSGSVRSPEGEHGSRPQYFCLENPTDRGAWWATVVGLHRVRHNGSNLAYMHANCPSMKEGEEMRLEDANSRSWRSESRLEHSDLPCVQNAKARCSFFLYFLSTNLTVFLNEWTELSNSLTAQTTKKYHSFRMMKCWHSGFQGEKKHQLLFSSVLWGKVIYTNNKP